MLTHCMIVAELRDYSIMLHFAVERDDCEESSFDGIQVDAVGCVCFDQVEPDEVCLSLAADGGDPEESSAAGFQVDVK